MNNMNANIACAIINCFLSSDDVTAINVQDIQVWDELN
jgi:hypothetical protein